MMRYMGIAFYAALLQMLLAWAVSAQPITENGNICQGRFTFVRAYNARLGWVIKELPDNLAKNALAEYNAIEPKTDFKADHVYMATNDHNDKVRIILADNPDCYVEAGPFPGLETEDDPQ